MHTGCTDGLSTVAATWPNLPDHIKAAVVALVSPYLPAEKEGTA